MKQEDDIGTIINAADGYHNELMDLLSAILEELELQTKMLGIIRAGQLAERAIMRESQSES